MAVEQVGVFEGDLDPIKSHLITGLSPTPKLPAQVGVTNVPRKPEYQNTASTADVKEQRKWGKLQHREYIMTASPR
jgi:hypothetical protein